jgi:hypothetical protein
MKTKKISKNLTLNKKTIAHLENGKMDAIYGGDGCTRVGLTCAYCPDTNGYTCVHGETCVDCETWDCPTYVGCSTWINC